MDNQIATIDAQNYDLMAEVMGIQINLFMLTLFPLDLFFNALDFHAGYPILILMQRERKVDM